LELHPSGRFRPGHKYMERSLQSTTHSGAPIVRRSDEVDDDEPGSDRCLKTAHNQRQRACGSDNGGTGRGDSDNPRLHRLSGAPRYLDDGIGQPPHHR